MSVLLFKLYNVPEDEAYEVRQLLAEHAFQTYETQTGFFGLGVTAIWLENDEQLHQARAVINRYQADRSARQRAFYAEQRASGEGPTLLKNLLAKPLQSLAMFALMILVLTVSFVPIWALIK